MLALFLLMLIAVSGSTCSGKTTLAKSLADSLSYSILCQDTFFKTDSQIPSLDGISNWDCPEAIDFPAFETALSKSNNTIVDGFLLESVTHLCHLTIFMHAPYETLKQRRDARTGYTTIEGSFAIEYLKGFWVDPEGYFEHVVYPEYLKNNSATMKRIGENSAFFISLDSSVLTTQDCLKRALAKIEEFSATSLIN